MQRSGPGGNFPVKLVHLKRWSCLTVRSERPKIVVPFSEILVSSPAPRQHAIAKMGTGILLPQDFGFLR